MARFPGQHPIGRGYAHHHLRHRLRGSGHRRVLRGGGQPRRLRGRRRRQGRPAQRRRGAHLRARSGDPGDAQPRRRAAGVHHRRRARRAPRQLPVHRRGHAVRRGRLRGPAVRALRGPDHRRAHERAPGHRRQVHGAGGHRGPCARGGLHGARRARRGDRLRRGLQPGIPQGGRRGGGLHEARPGDRRHRRRRRRRAHARALRALQPQPRPPDRHGRALRGAHQVRRQRDAGRQDQLHERARQPRRPRRRGYRARARGHGLGPADRLPLHLSRGRLRRLVLPQGRARAGTHRLRRGLRAADAPGGGGRQRAPEELSVHPAA
ncbi:hypothetical protein KBTX_01541 [wastewater metagenome]|uniref:Uncharacterized protein n=2 Tax=unclassified sequences TaxID=12908 RepID=A0A5B8R9I1_9ZZZZ|nr:hypothetical protein KBTEX_01541 [uncultured organism]